ncbi:hypothetical protein ABEF95_010038 [Exophiala dermatitidis]
MSETNDNQASPSSHPPPEPSSLRPNHVYLRVIYLVTGNPRPPHNLGQVNLDTTVSALKDRIQNDLPEHPAPSEQRLIYQGRPLLRNESTLKEVLRLDSGAAVGPLPYTIHIVIHPRHDAASTANAPDTANPPVAPPRHLDRLNPIRAVEASAARLQESLARIQQQIEVNRADLANVQQRIGFQHPHTANGQPTPAAPALNAQAAFAVPLPLLFTAGQALGQPHAVHPNNLQGQGQAVPSRLRSPGMPPPLQPQLVFPPQPPQFTMGTRTQPTGPTSQASQSGHTPDQTQTQPTNPAAPNPQATSAPQVPLPQFQTHHQIFTGQPIPGQLVAPILPAHFQAHFARHPLGVNTNSSAMAWIVISPAGPEGLLFAPGHGFFTTSPQHVPDPSPEQNASTINQPPARSAPLPQEGDGALNNNARRAHPRRGRRRDVPALPQARRIEVDNDLFGFLIQRGWLFLRLYLLMFVFSEPGSWRRWLLIVVAAIVCLQPRNGPVARAVTAARLHLDNLVFPPVAQPRPAQANQQPLNQPHADATGDGPVDRSGQRPVNVRGAVQMTPEEAAARLIRQHQDGVRGSWRDTLYRIEQSTALFLASLVPGVGERYVRAREEARRAAERLEQERLRAQEEEAARTQEAANSGENQPDGAIQEAADSQHGDAKAQGPVEQSTSTSVEAHEDGSSSAGLRNRER